MKLQEMQEKDFIKKILSKYAVTAAANRFEDCIIIDLQTLCGGGGVHPGNLPYLVYSIDHPSFIRRNLGEEIDHRFYGRWVAAAVCGDVLAMGARPRGFSLDLAAPLEMDTRHIEWIFQGLRDVLDVYGAVLEGGNLDTNALEIVGMAWGLVSRENILYRSGARPGDYVTVTGVLGHGWADWLSRKLGKFESLPPETQQNFREYKLMPLAPHQSILAAVHNGGVTSGMDLTDGLVDYLYTIHERTGLGVTLHEDWFPVSAGMQQAADLLAVRPGLLALEAGYDTPLIHGWTVSPAAWPAIETIFHQHGQTIYKIGVVTPQPDILLQRDGKSAPLGRFWDDQFLKGHLVERWFDFIQGL